jgi:transcriptional regulator with XRE-family HTH domain
MPRALPALPLEDAQRQQLQQWIAAFGTPRQVSLRSQIVLAAAEGEADHAIAQRLQVSRPTVSLWRTRFAQGGPQSLWEIAPGRGRKAMYGPEKIQAIVEATLQSKPKGMTQWSCRLMAEAQGVSKSTISNIWRSHHLKPHRVKSFKLSRDGLTGQTVVSTENRVGCGAFGHAISPQFTPSEARSAEISCCDIHLTIFIASEIPTFVSYSPLRRRLTTNHARDCAQVYVAHRKAGQKRLGTSPLATTRSQPGNPWEVAITPMVLPCHEPSLLSSPAARCGSQGRTKIFFDCARATVAMRLSGSVALVIVGSDIAVRGAEPQPGRNSSA